MWFKAKSYGWGWTPASWEGWLVTALFVVGLFLAARYTILVDDTKVAEFFAYEAGLILLLIVICWKTGEKPKWRWGR